MPIDLMPGFSWTVPFFFQDSISTYHFTHGDTIYQSAKGYEAGIYTGHRVMVRTTESQRQIDKAEREIEKATQKTNLDDDHKQTRRVAQNWNSPITIDFYKNEDLQQFEVTQGHLYTLLWKGDDRILLNSTPPLIPKRANDAIKILRICQHQDKSYYKNTYEDLLNEPGIGTVLQTIGKSLRSLWPTKQPKLYFCLPFNLGDRMSTSKHERVTKILTHDCGGMNKVFTLKELHFPQDQFYAPTTRIAVTLLDSSNSLEDITETLKPILYIPNPKVSEENQRFSLDHHGFLIGDAS